MTPPPTLKQGSTHPGVLPLPPFSPSLSFSVSHSFLRVSLLSRPISFALSFSSSTFSSSSSGASSLRTVQIKFSSTVKQCRYPTRNNPPLPPDRREFPRFHPSFPLPPALRRASRIPLVSGRMDRTRIDRINYSLLTIIVQAERTVGRPIVATIVRYSLVDLEESRPVI